MVRRQASLRAVYFQKEFDTRLASSYIFHLMFWKIVRLLGMETIIFFWREDPIL